MKIRARVSSVDMAGRTVGPPLASPSCINYGLTINLSGKYSVINM